MPSVRERFKTFHDFASAGLRDIYGDRLDSALRLEVTTAETGIFVNDGQGRFAFKPLPAEAQIAPVMGTVATHLDADGYLDIALAQNFFGSQRETGRMSGGLSLVLLGRGDGDFLPLAPAASGIALTGDARSLAAPDLNGDQRPDLAFAHRDERPRFFLNGSADLNYLAVRLEGNAGNRSGVGARLVFEHVDGRREARDMAAGSGCLTQNPAEIHHSFVSSNPVRAIDVVWPDGTRTRSAVPSRGGALILQLGQGE